MSASEPVRIERRTTYAYDAHGNLESMTSGLDPADAAVEGATTSYVYDEAGQLLEQVGPDGATTTFAYDDAGRLTLCPAIVSASSSSLQDGGCCCAAVASSR